MSGALKSVVAAVTGALALVPLSGTAQRPPDLSGHWVLVSASALNPVGRSASGLRPRSTPSTTPTTKTMETGARAEQPITSNSVSGAPFNCGRECTLVQKGQTLTIENAYLESRPTPAPAITLQLDGRETSVVDSYSPWVHIPLTAQWTGGQLKITSTENTCTTTQLVSIEATQLVVVTSAEISDQPTFKARATFRYKKK